MDLRPLRVWTAALLAFCLGPPVIRAADGSLVSRSGCVFAEYDKTAGLDRYASKSEYQKVTTDANFTCQKLTYASGGLPVAAFLYRPSDTPRSRLPVLIYNRGSWVVNNQLPLLATMFHRFAEAGFVVIAPMYRGSEGAPGRDEFGGADLSDLFNVLLLAKQLPFVDSENTFLYGESRGGVMALMALRDGFPARAAATFGAFTDFAAYLEMDPRARQAVNVVWPDYDEKREHIWTTRSAIRWPERINAPLLLMHGGADRQVSPIQTLNLATRLEELGKEYGLHVFGGDDHLISQHRVERDQQALIWFKKHLKNTAGESPRGLRP